MIKRVKNLLLGALMVIAVFVCFGFAETFAQTLDGVQIGTYKNSEYSSHVKFKADRTFEIKYNFGEGYITVLGNWRAEELDTGETGVFLRVTSSHMGINVEEGYTFTGDLRNNDTLYLSDGDLGVCPVETEFVIDKSTVTQAATPVQSGATVEDGKTKVLSAVKSNAANVSNDFDKALSSRRSYSGYRGMSLDSWAVKEVGIADYMSLMPSEVNDYFHESIMRADFAALVYQSLIRLSGMTESELQAAVPSRIFTDCSDKRVGVCAGLGIISGYSDGSFKPYNTITRQEAATMLSRLAETVGAQGKGSTLSFSDVYGLWGESYVRNVSKLVDPYTGNAVMGGTGGGRFSPNGLYSRQQAVATIVRIVGVTLGTHSELEAVEPKPASNSETVNEVANLFAAKAEEIFGSGDITEQQRVEFYNYAKELEREGKISDLSLDEYVLSYEFKNGFMGAYIMSRLDDGTIGAGKPAVSTLTDTESDSAANYMVVGNKKMYFLSVFPTSAPVFGTYHSSIIIDIKAKMTARSFTAEQKVNATIEDFKDLDKYGVICILAHGFRSKEQSNLCIEAVATDQQMDVTYAADLSKKNARMGIVQRASDGKKRLFMRPKFFTHYYTSKKMPKSYVHLSSCQSLKEADISLAKAIYDAGARCVGGYENIVSVADDRARLTARLENLLSEKGIGMTALEANTEAGKKYPNVFTTKTSTAEYPNRIFTWGQADLRLYANPEEVGDKEKEETKDDEKTDEAGNSGDESATIGDETTYGENVIGASGTYSLSSTMGGTTICSYTVAFTNTSDKDITGFKYLTHRNGILANSPQLIMKERTRSDYSLQPGETYTLQLRTAGNIQSMSVSITAYTHGDPQSDSGWVVILPEDQEVVSLTEVPYQ